MIGLKRQMIRGIFSQCGVLAMGKYKGYSVRVHHKFLNLCDTRFELLTVLSSKDQSRLTDCDSQVIEIYEL